MPHTAWTADHAQPLRLPELPPQEELPPYLALFSGMHMYKKFEAHWFQPGPDNVIIMPYSCLHKVPNVKTTMKYLRSWLSQLMETWPIARFKPWMFTHTPQMYSSTLKVSLFPSVCIYHISNKNTVFNITHTWNHDRWVIAHPCIVRWTKYEHSVSDQYDQLRLYTLPFTIWNTETLKHHINIEHFEWRLKAFAKHFTNKQHCLRPFVIALIAELLTARTCRCEFFIILYENQRNNLTWRCVAT